MCFSGWKPHLTACASALLGLVICLQPARVLVVLVEKGARVSIGLHVGSQAGLFESPNAQGPAVPPCPLVLLGPGVSVCLHIFVSHIPCASTAGEGVRE